MKYPEAKAKAEILKAMAHPVRLIVVDALSKGDRCVCDLNKLVGVDQSTLSRHLAQLKRVGVVSERKEGVKVIHHLACPCILQAMDCAAEVFKTEAGRRSAVLRGAGS